MSLFTELKIHLMMVCKTSVIGREFHDVTGTERYSTRGQQTHTHKSLTHTDVD